MAFALTFTPGIGDVVPEVPATVYETTIGVTDATIDEGQSLNYTIDLDRNALPAVVFSFQVRFPVALVGAVDPDEANASSFVLNHTDYLRAVATAYNVAHPSDPCIFTSAGSPTVTVYTYVMPVTWNGHLDFPRLTIVNPANQGDRITGLELVNVSAGVILENGSPVPSAYVSVVIHDLQAAPPEGDLASLTFAGLPLTVGPALLINAAENTLVGYLSGLDAAGLPVTLDGFEFVTSGNEGGIFKKGVFVLGSGWEILVGAVAPDFEGPVAPSGFTLGKPFYSPAVTGEANGVFATAQLKVRPKFPKVNPTGGIGGTQVLPTDNAGVLAAFAGSNREIRFAGFIGTAVRTSSQPSMTGSNVTVLGHPRFLCIRGTGPNMRLTNGLVVNLACAAGGDVAGQARSSRDSCNLGNGNNVIVRNCSFCWSIDELCSLATPNPALQARRMEFIYCIFFNPLRQAGHDNSEPLHDFGMLMNARNMGVVIHLCLFLNCHARHPDCNGPLYGLHCFNNLYINYKATGISINALQGQGSTCIVEGNLWLPRDANARKRTFVGYSNIGTGSFMYVPTSGNYVNHQVSFSGGAWNFADSPVLPNDTFSSYQSGATSAWYCNFRPFEQADDYGILPTSTPAERSTLFFHVLDNVGCRYLVDPTDPLSPGIPGDLNAQFETYDVLRQLRASGAAAMETGGVTSTWPGDGTGYQLVLDTVAGKFRTTAQPYA